MKPRKSTYLIHRWIGLIVSLQLLAWSLGGFMFSILAIDNVRGERDIASPPCDPLSPTARDALPTPVRDALTTLGEAERDVGKVTLIDRGLGPTWEIRDIEEKLLLRVNTEGKPLPRLSREQAEHVARREFQGSPAVRETTLIESNPPVEYRSGSLPAYLVELEHAKAPHLYVNARTGEIAARRNRVWRIFDFFWMLHTMDYQGRDSFNHLLLTAFSVLAILTSASGLSLWIWRAASRIKVHRSRKATARKTAKRDLGPE